jgi:electron transport complex protein RnfG
LICCFSGGLLSYVNERTKGPIAESIRLEKIRAIKEVLSARFPDITISKDPDKDCKTIQVKDSETGKDKEVIFYQGKDGSGNTLGVAVKTASFVGYSGKISLMFGFNLAGEVTGTYVLEHAETPGLGSKIKEKPFTEQFSSLERRSEDLKITKFGGTIESISGASISSHAFTSALNEALKLYTENYLKGETGNE